MPRCPSGTEKKGESCTTVAKLEVKKETAPPTPGTPVQEVTSFTLADTSVVAKSQLVFRFPARVASPSGDASWVSISPANSANTSYLTWTFVTDKASSAELVVPEKPGTYEARLYTHYPKQSYNVAHRVAFTVEALAEAPDAPTVERFKLADPSLAPGQMIRILFPGAMVAKKGERYWVTVVAAGAPDTKYDAWEYVADRSRSASLKAPPTPGDYEVRLHANYPTKSTNVVFRVPLAVK